MDDEMTPPVASGMFTPVMNRCGAVPTSAYDPRTLRNEMPAAERSVIEEMTAERPTEG